MSDSSSRQPNHDVPLHALNVDFDDLAKCDPEWAAISKSAKEAKWLDFQDSKVVRYANTATTRMPIANYDTDNSQKAF